jgi:hypothetical protein
MAATRSPRYPNVSLGEAVVRAKSIYTKEHMSTMSPAVAAEAMGYGGINGASLKTISALRKYGLLEGRGDDVRLSKDAQTLIIDDSNSPDYRSALRRCALNVELFSELKKQFPGTASDRNIAVYLEKQGFKPDGAARAAKNFRDTFALVGDESEAYDSRSVDDTDRTGAPTMQAHSADNARAAGPSPFLEKAMPQGGVPLRVIMNGNRLDIQASVDLAGLKKLQAMLAKYQGILEMMGDGDDEAAN